MKRTICTLVFLTLAGPIQATSFNDPEPEHYYFSYKTQQNRIVESSVCSRYSGMDWKGCRRYANWVFAKKCWDYRYELRKASGAHRELIKQAKDRFCDAKRRINVL